MSVPFDRPRASLLGLGSVNASGGGLLVADTPVVQSGKHWVVQKATIWLLGDTGSPNPDLGASGIFLCPPGTPASGIPIGALRAPSYINWWETGGYTDDNNNDSLEYDIPFILPSGWWLRFLWVPTVSDPLTGCSLYGPYMYEIEDNC
jgi:hypothetical protein